MSSLREVSIVAVLAGILKLPVVFCPKCDDLRVFFSVVSGGGRLKVVSTGSYLKVQSSAKNCCDRIKLIFNTGSGVAVDSHETSVVSYLEPSLKRS